MFLRQIFFQGITALITKCAELNTKLSTFVNILVLNSHVYIFGGVK